VRRFGLRVPERDRMQITNLDSTAYGTRISATRANKDTRRAQPESCDHPPAQNTADPRDSSFHALIFRPTRSAEEAAASSSKGGM
jgi:hypothetical protein